MIQAKRPRKAQVLGSSLERIIWDVGEEESQKVIENRLDASGSLRGPVPLNSTNQGRKEEIMEDQPTLGI